MGLIGSFHVPRSWITDLFGLDKKGTGRYEWDSNSLTNFSHHWWGFQPVKDSTAHKNTTFYYQLLLQDYPSLTILLLNRLDTLKLALLLCTCFQSPRKEDVRRGTTTGAKYTWKSTKKTSQDAIVLTTSKQTNQNVMQKNLKCVWNLCSRRILGIGLELAWNCG